MNMMTVTDPIAPVSPYKPNIESKKLVELALQGTAEEYHAALQETGSAVLGHALEVFCDTNRETPDGAAAAKQLLDLKNSVIAHLRRNKEETAGNAEALQDKAAAITDGTDPLLLLSDSKIERLRNVPLWGDTSGCTYKYLERHSEREKVDIETPALDPMGGVRKFLTQLNGVLGLYTAAVMIPGPLSATLKTVSQQLSSSHSQFDSSSSGSSQAEGVAISLLGLGAYGSASESSSQAKGSSDAESRSTTIDERIVPVLGELQERLAQASVVPASEGKIVAKQSIFDWVGQQYWLPPIVAYRDFAGQGAGRRELETKEYQPSHVRVPDTSISDYVKPKDSVL